MHAQYDTQAAEASTAGALVSAAPASATASASPAGDASTAPLPASSGAGGVCPPSLAVASSLASGVEGVDEEDEHAALHVTRPPGMPFDCGAFEIVEEDWPAAELPRARSVAEGRDAWLAEPI